MGLYSGGAYIWNEVSVSTCGGLIHGGGGGGYIRGAYSRRFTVEDQNYGKLAISWDNSILPSYCALKANKYVSVCWPR